MGSAIVQQTYLSFDIVCLGQRALALCPQPELWPGIACQQRKPSRENCCKHMGCNGPSWQLIPYEAPGNLESSARPATNLCPER